MCKFTGRGAADGKPVAVERTGDALSAATERGAIRIRPVTDLRPGSPDWRRSTRSAVWLMTRYAARPYRRTAVAPRSAVSTACAHALLSTRSM
jgi:hypothetical protein